MTGLKICQTNEARKQSFHKRRLSCFTNFDTFPFILAQPDVWSGLYCQDNVSENPETGSLVISMLTCIILII